MYKNMVELNDNLTEIFFEKQIDDEESRYFGGVVDAKTGIPSPSHTGVGSVLGSWLSSYVNPDSRFYHYDLLARRIDKALDYMLDQQHEDGTISPGWTNYHSPPDTGFIVTGFAHIYHLLKNDSGLEADSLTSKVKSFLERTIPAMLTGGCHTPNHRWVLTSALCHLYTIFGNDELLDRVEEWLAEGIDITKDGEWTERSNGIYNSVSNIFLYHTARIGNKPKLLDYVRKNLDMMQYLVHPDGEVVTDYSGRQDFGNVFDLSPYHLICRLMAFHDNNPVYAAMSDLAAENLSEMGPVNNHIMIGYLMFPFIKEQKVGKTALPTNYEVLINGDFPGIDNLKKMNLVGHGSKIEHSSMHESFGAPIVRFRQSEESATIMSKNASFFSLRKGNAKLLGVRVTSSFSPGIIEFDTIEKIDDGYRLKKQMEKGYRGPIPKQQLANMEDTSIWYLLPHQHRGLTHSQTFEVEIDIVKTSDSEWKLYVKSDDREDVFMQIEFLFNTDGLLKGDEITRVNERTYFWKRDELTFQSGENYIHMNTGTHEHWIENIGGAGELNNVQAVKVNLVSPIDKTFRVWIK
ncbi:hypothetical protein [Metabacillus sp. FJAT-53654]|uniref:Heparin-sulfate lyase N-terminal domain-containing protein n=1 Tax=Metabacillus rhizosphaerae TaxID=3117747 RepID=A0ABZ2MMD4_9BACI